MEIQLWVEGEEEEEILVEVMEVMVVQWSLPGWLGHHQMVSCHLRK